MSGTSASSRMDLSFKDFQRFFTHSKNLIGFVDRDGTIYPLNSAWETVTGIQLTEIPVKGWREFVYEEDHKATKEAMKLAFQTGNMQLEHRVLHKDGQFVWISWDVFYDQEEEKAYMIGTNITEKKEIEANLLEMKEYYEALIEGAQVAIHIITVDGKVISVNPEFENIYGWTREEVLGRKLPTLPPSKREEFKYIIHQINNAQKVRGLRTERLHKHGHTLTISLTASPIRNKRGEIIAYCSFSRDISNEIALEKRLHEKRVKLELANNRMTDILESITDGFCLVDKNFRISHVNQSFKTFVNGEPSHFLGSSLWLHLPESHCVKYGSIYKEALLQQTARRFQDYFPLIDKYVVVSVSPTKEGLLIFFQDNTRQIKSIQALEESERRFQQITNNISEVFWIIEPGGETWKYISPAFDDLYGASRSLLMNNEVNWDELVHPEDAHIIADGLKRMNMEEVVMEYRKLNMAGSEKEDKWLRSKGFPVFRNGKIDLIVGITEDITEQKEHDSLLIKSEKLTTVGQLAAGIAHEIRNPLTAIKGFVQILSSNPHVQKAYTSILMSELARIEQIVNEFLLLSKPPQDLTLRPYSIAQILTEVVSLLRAEANLQGIEIIEEWECNVPELDCEPNQLKQSFINLIKNAIEAMESNGKIIVKGQLLDQMIVIQVVDEGPGISQERLEKLGEPFYSTKEKGTGLGLMITMKMIENHGGRLYFESEVGIGTTATVILPLL